MGFNKEEQKKFRELFYNGADVRYIATELGCTPYKVRKYIVEKNLYDKRFEKKMAKREKELRKMFAEGKTTAEMADALNLAPSSILKALASYGLNGKDRKREKQKIQLRQYLEEGLPHREIAVKMGKSLSGIEYLIKSYGYVGLLKKKEK